MDAGAVCVSSYSSLTLASSRVCFASLRCSVVALVRLAPLPPQFTLPPTLYLIPLSVNTLSLVYPYYPPRTSLHPSPPLSLNRGSPYLPPYPRFSNPGSPMDIILIYDTRWLYARSDTLVPQRTMCRENPLCTEASVSIRNY